jgi:hypothetical protein
MTGRQPNGWEIRHRTRTRPRSLGLMMLTSVAMVLTVMPGRAVGRQRQPTNEDCIDCHQRLDDSSLVRPTIDFPTDIHAERGFGCLSCHGPDPTGAGAPPDPATGFLSRPTRAGVIAMCGRCHSNADMMRAYNPARRVDQVAEYESSVHGMRLAKFGDPKVAVCTSCHPAHRIRPPSDNQSSVYPLHVAETCGACHSDSTRMASYGIPTDQREEYEQSVHWQWMNDEADLSAPTCNDCHGNHGAAPPGVSSVLNVCGQCHSVMATMFSEGPHNDPFLEAGLPGCATCHSNHAIHKPSDDMLLEVRDRVCSRCHAHGEVGSETFGTIRVMIDSLLMAIDSSRLTLEEAENLGMEVSQAQFTLEEASTSLVKARAAIHTFSEDSVRQEVVAGMAVAGRASERGRDALHEHAFRREGLAVSVGLILLLIVALALRIRELERTPSSGPRFHTTGVSEEQRPTRHQPANRLGRRSWSGSSREASRRGCWAPASADWRRRWSIPSCGI